MYCSCRRGIKAGCRPFGANSSGILSFCNQFTNSALASFNWHSRFPAVFLTVIVGLGILSPVVFIGLNMLTEFQNNFDIYNEGLTKKVGEFQKWVEETLDYEMTIDAQNVISTIQSSVFNFIGGAAGFLKDFTFVVILMIFFLSEAVVFQESS